MAEYGELETISMDADADLSLHRYHIVRATSAKGVNVASLSTPIEVIGVLQNQPESGEIAAVAYSGKSKIQVGAAIGANKFFTTNASGRGVICTSGDMAVGRILEASTANGDIVTCLLNVPFRMFGVN